MSEARLNYIESRLARRKLRIGVHKDCTKFIVVSVLFDLSKVPTPRPKRRTSHVGYMRSSFTADLFQVERFSNRSALLPNAPPSALSIALDGIFAVYGLTCQSPHLNDAVV